MKTKITNHLQEERGVAAFIALALVVMLSAVGIIAIKNSNDEVNLAGNERTQSVAFYAAEAGLEQATAAIQTEYENTNAPPSVLPTGTVSLNNSTVTYKTADDGPAVNRTITSGSMAGLNASVKTFTVVAVSENTISKGKVELTEQFETSQIPLFQFAIFYENDLELHTDQNMTMSGRIHSNGDIYLDSDGTISLEDQVTSAGDILHGRDPNSGLTNGSGQVEIEDASGSFQGMLMGGTWLDAASPTWYDSSVSRWGGTVQDATHGQDGLAVPLAGGADPHKIIEPSNGGANPNSLENDATIKIVNQKVLQLSGGTWVNVTTTANSEGWYSTTNNAFTDYRESADVDAVVIDMSLFKSSSLFPSNGIVYVTDDSPSRDFPALQLKNGSDIGGPLSFVSENPIYIEGDYNTTNKQPASVIADAVTFLSNNWDAIKAQPNKTDRLAAATSVNVSIMTGNTPSAGNVYSGGAENLPRMLEDWTGKDFTLRGSMVNMWESVQANTAWSVGHFSAPNRDWGFDPDLADPANIPPGTPSAQSFARIGWNHKDIGFSNVAGAADAKGNGNGKP